MESKFFTTRRMAQISILSALSFVLYLINIPLAFAFPSFLKLNISDFPALIGGFAMGPISGALIVLVKILIKLPFTDTMGVGELSDLLNSLFFVIPSALIYKKFHTKKGAILALLVGSICSVISAMICNPLFIIPFYMHAYHMTFESLSKMCSVLFTITPDKFYLFYEFAIVLPFNLLRCLIVSLVTFLAYKSLMKLINKMYE